MISNEENIPTDQCLDVSVEGGNLVIKIGIDTLAWASSRKNGGPLLFWDVNPTKHQEWAKDIAHEMEAENEIGESPLTDFLDEMIQKAADNGSIGIKPSKWCPKNLRGRR